VRTRTPMSPRRFAAGLAGLAVVAGVAWLAVLAVVTPLVLGWKSVVVTSGSMEPALHRGDVVLAPPYEGKRLGKGTVVVFEDGERGLMTHRVVARNEDGSYQTRGDNNPAPDSTPLRPEQIIATGRAMVPRIGIVSVLAQEGRWGDLAVLGALVAGAGVLARSALRGRPEWSGGPLPPRHKARLVGAAVACQLVLALAALPGARAAWIAPTSNGVNTMASAAAWQQWYLNTPVEGVDSVAVTDLTLGTTKPAYAGALPNYDTDRDADPGLTVVRGNLGLAETDPAKFQRWYLPPTPGAKNFSGNVRLRLYSAVRNFHPTARGSMTAGLYVCALGPTNCNLQASVTVDRPGGWAAGATTFVDTVFDFGAVNFPMPGNHDIAVKVVANAAGSDDDMWLAYDTTTWSAAVQRT
jgi:signal peptidase I